MRFLTFLFIFLTFISGYAEAKVFLIARSLREYDTQSKTYKGTDYYAHSFIVIVPDNPASPEMLRYKDLFINLGAGKQGFIIAAYPRKYNKTDTRIDGDLVALYNPPNDIAAARDFFENKNMDVWQFVWGVVKSDLGDTAFINTLKENTDNYIRNSHTDYDFVGSIMEEVLFNKENVAKNCNAFAFSLLTYSYATRIPDLCAKRKIPGCRTLLNRDYFMMLPNLPYIAQPINDLPAVKNDTDHKKRIKEKLNPLGSPFYEIIKKKFLNKKQ